MADPVTMSDIAQLSKDHSDIRREAAEHTNEIVKEGLKESFNMRGDIKDTRHDISSRIASSNSDLSRQVDAIDDTLTSHLFTLSRESADNRAQILGLTFQVRDGFASNAKDGEIAVLKNTIEGQKNTQYLAEKISSDGEKTRAMLADINSSDLNRLLIERNSELVEERDGRRYWRHHADANQYQGQWAALQSQIQAFQSQLQETRQGLYNFGTMAGVGQSSTSNNVR